MTDFPFAVSAPIGSGGIDEIHAEVERLVHGCDGLIHAHVEHRHAPESDSRYLTRILQARAHLTSQYLSWSIPKQHQKATNKQPHYKIDELNRHECAA